MTRIKVCGLTRPQDVDLAVECGVDFLGFNLWRGSPRYIRAQDAASLVARLVPGGPIPVGVFVHGADDDLVCANLARVAWVQVHGTPLNWTSAGIARPVLRGIPARAGLSLADLTGADYWILDKMQTGHGGGGKPFDWELAGLLAGHPRLFLAGGLVPANVGEAIRRLKPYAVDVASGCESSPGIKSKEKLEAFVAAVRAADREAGGT